MPSPLRAFGHVLLALIVAVTVVFVPLRMADEGASALPAVPRAMHGITCGEEMSGAMDHAAHGGMLMPTSAACSAFRPAISMKGWTAIASSSAKGHPAGAALTGGTRTWWQSKTKARGFRTQTLVLRTRSTKTVTGLQYQPAGGRGSIGRFEVRLSTDGRRFGAVVAAGRWQQDSVTKQVGWNPTRVRAVKIIIRTVSPARARSVTAATIGLTGVEPVAATPAPAPEQSPAPEPGPSTGTPAPSSDPIPSTAPTTTVPAPRNPAVVGLWGPTIAFPLVPVAVASIPGNRLVVWAAENDMSFNNAVDSAATQTAVLDLTTGAVSATRVSNTGHDMFCPGVSLLADGRILVTGGISNRETSIYDPQTDSWSAGPKMNIGRGYQGQTTLSGGGAFTIGGSWSGALGGKLGEVYSPDGWRVLPNVTTDPMVTADREGISKADGHAWLIAGPGNTVLQAGPSKQMNWISTTSDGAMSPAGVRAGADDQMNGNAVLFDVNKVLTVGGATSYSGVEATGTADVLDLSAGYGKPVISTPTAALAHPRSYANSIVLPSGDVVTIGGMSPAMSFSDTGSVLTPELWSPATGSWIEMADQAEPRNYHSVAVLLPDGTVFSGGGGLCGDCATNHPTGQIFSPPYLFDKDGSAAARPTIGAVPASVAPGQAISFTASADATQFVLVRAGESTHSVDNDQRRVPLTVIRDGGNVSATIPADNGVVLPGRYMLFALTAAGVPSISAPLTITVTR